MCVARGSVSPVTEPSVPTVSVDDMPPGVTVLDVREPAEWVAGHVPDALHIPLRQLPARLPEVPSGQRVVCVCRVGARSAQATAFLTAHGVDAVNLTGGMHAWQAVGRTLVSENGEPPRVV